MVMDASDEARAKEVMVAHLGVVRDQLALMHHFMHTLEARSVDPARLQRGTAHVSDTLPFVPLSAAEVALQSCIDVHGVLVTAQIPVVECIMARTRDLETQRLIVNILHTVRPDTPAMLAIAPLAGKASHWFMLTVGQFRIAQGT